MTETFFYTDHRQPRSGVAETDRLMPAGVRKHIREVKTGEDLSHLPLVILDWMFEHDLVTVSKRGKNKGSTILSSLGQQVRSTNLKRMEGKND